MDSKDLNRFNEDCKESLRKLRIEFISNLTILKENKPLISLSTIISYLAAILDSWGGDLPLSTLHFIKQAFHTLDDNTIFNDSDLVKLRKAVSMTKESKLNEVPEDTINSCVKGDGQLDIYIYIFTLTLPYLQNEAFIAKLKELDLPLPFDTAKSIPISFNTGWLAMFLHIFGLFEIIKVVNRDLHFAYNTNYRNVIWLKCPLDHPCMTPNLFSVFYVNNVSVLPSDNKTLVPYLNFFILFTVLPYITKFNINFEEKSIFDKWYTICEMYLIDNTKMRRAMKDLAKPFVKAQEKRKRKKKINK
jgi:hypothetical protein